MRTKLLALAGVAVPAILTLLAWSQTWFVVHLQNAQLAIGGDAAASALPPLALSTLALVLALTIAGGFFRIVLGILASGLGLCIALTAVIALRDPLAAAAPAITKLTGVSGTSSIAELVTSVDTTVWPAVTIVAGVLGILAGIAVVVTARRWPASGRRYSRTRVEAPDGRRVTDWDALSDGDDPTEGTLPDATRPLD